MGCEAKFRNLGSWSNDDVRFKIVDLRLQNEDLRISRLF